ncbi:aldose 1-epimerase family protein [Nocardioides islandensis]|uniref:aldose 1-epimerase family protein n=1 Tax=Nocardioides islandensis TaxID=433663 RepID=UPI002B27A846|nr:aldose 1-epimerase family protein [Nocardioides islandensis]
MFAPSGRQFQITRGDQRATIVEVGGGVREYRVGERDVLQPYGLDRMRDGAHGAPLIPWPNRLADGRYSFDGTEHQVALTEPDKHNAIHGFLLWRQWEPTDEHVDGITMKATLLPLQGFPFALQVEVAYQLGSDGLSVTTTATNIGDVPAPFGSGHHPYLSPGAGLIDDCELHLEAETRIVTDSKRQLPVGREPVTGTDYDFRKGKAVGDLLIDYPFTDLHRDAEDRARVRLTGTDGRTVHLWVDTSYPIVEVYTGDTLSPGRRRRGLGTEPMTCPPNAFHTGEDLIRLDPGAVTSSRWGVSLAP